MATEKTLQERLQEWSDEVAETYKDENATVAEEIQALGGPDEATQLAAIEWANNVDQDELLFLLAVSVSEVVRRFGVEATNATLSSLLDTPAIAAIGEVVHAFKVVDDGGVPEVFELEDMEARLRDALENGDAGEVIVINMETGEIT